MSNHSYLPTVVSILKVKEDHDRMDCEDNDPRKVWVVIGAWSGRRAVLTHAAPFVDAAGTSDLASLEGRTFMCRLDLSSPPAFEHEGGERLEWPELRLAPPMSEVYARLGITPPEEQPAAQPYRLTGTAALSPAPAPEPAADPWPTIARLVQWLDDANDRTDQEITLRLLKLSEEVGEVSQAWIGTLGQNPRKGYSHHIGHVTDELCDVIVTAMVALTSITDVPGEVFDQKIASIAALRLPAVDGEL